MAAMLAYGRVASILASIDDLFARMPEGPATFLDRFDHARDAARLDGFVHRWTRGSDLARALGATATLQRRHGGLERAFLAVDDASEDDVGGALARFSDALLAVAPDGDPARDRALRFLLPRFGGGSAAKRLCLFLRWMAREDDGVDLGLWPDLDPSRLIVPLDTHVFRISGFLGLTDRRSPDARAAVEITCGLRALDAHDPLRYDFALAHLGILGDCPSRPDPDLCDPCPLRSACRCWSPGAATTAPRRRTRSPRRSPRRRRSP